MARAVSRVVGGGPPHGWYGQMYIELGLGLTALWALIKYHPHQLGNRPKRDQLKAGPQTDAVPPPDVHQRDRACAGWPGSKP